MLDIAAGYEQSEWTAPDTIAVLRRSCDRAAGGLSMVHRLVQPQRQPLCRLQDRRFLRFEAEFLLRTGGSVQHSIGKRSKGLWRQ